MAKILVADDNSNVQKTVALALADLGVDVVSVNNGEAAVRKLSDFSPDLILADIFMPVRNGYEVCEYVKKDSRFSRVPVVLLVGAFDPLDEREAQRVGADGILKKPFVPPDPLITMVKTLLQRTLGDRLTAVAASKPAVAVQARSGRSPVAEMRSPAAETSEESPSQAFPLPTERVAFGAGDHPVAFSKLLEAAAQGSAAKNTVAIEPVEDEQILTSPRDATLGDPIFWRNDSREEPETERLPETPSGVERKTWGPGEDSLPRRDEASLLQPIEPLELVREEQEESSPALVDTQSILLDQAAQAALTVESEKPEDLAANPIEWMSTAPVEQPVQALEEVPGWNEPASDASPTINRTESPEHQLEPVEASNATLGANAPVSVADEQTDRAEASEHQLEPIVEAANATTGGDEPVLIADEPTDREEHSHHQSDEQRDLIETSKTTSEPDEPVSNAVEAAVESVAQTDSSDHQLDSEQVSPEVSVPIPAPVLAPVFAHSDAPIADTAPAPEASKPRVSIPQETHVAFNPSAQSALDTARSVPKQDWADLAASLQPRDSERITPQIRSESTPAVQVPVTPAEHYKSALANRAHEAVPDPALVEAVVQRVLEKMRPQVVAIITNEFLRPIVQALVRREIERP